MMKKLQRTIFNFNLYLTWPRLRRALNSLLHPPIILPIVIFLFLSMAAHAQQSVVTLDPGNTNIDFTLEATLHTVHGNFELKSGQIRFDPSSGSAEGSIVIDATSANTGNHSRDQNMHGEILESARFPEIIFTPNSMKNADFLTPGRRGTAEVEVSGTVRLLGQDHDAVLKISVQPEEDGQMKISTRLSVPYVKWGLKNPSTFLLRVSDTVEVDIQAKVKVTNEK
jgi:polyisoprenoid-binding protein YceI